MDTVPILVWISLATNCFSVGKELKEICEFEIQKDANTLDEKGKRKFQNFMNIYDKGNKELDKRYETDVREKLLNFREYHTEQK